MTISSQVLRLLARWAARRSVALMAAAAGAGAAAAVLSQGPGVVPLMAGTRAMSAQVDLGGRRFRFRHLEIGSGLEAEHAGDHVRGEALHHVVQAHHAVVVELAGGGGLVFSLPPHLPPTGHVS